MLYASPELGSGDIDIKAQPLLLKLPALTKERDIQRVPKKCIHILRKENIVLKM